jgi:hypothetical protein
MKKLIVVAALAIASLFGGMTAAHAAGVDVCYDVNINGTAQSGCQNIPVPALPL